MSWSSEANNAMSTVKDSSGASAAEMGSLMTDMSNWANQHQNGPQFIPFGKFRNHGVSFSVVNGEIQNVGYGDR